MIYIKSNEYNIINNYNDKVKMILRSRLEANIKYVVTTICGNNHHVVTTGGSFAATHRLVTGDVLKAPRHKRSAWF